MDPEAFTGIGSLNLGNVYAKVQGFAAAQGAQVIFFTDYGRIVLKGTKLFLACAASAGPNCTNPYQDTSASAILAEAFATASRRGDQVK